MRITLLQSILPDYRLPVFLSLCEQLGDKFRLAVSVDEIREGFQTPDFPASNLIAVANKYVLGGRLQVQTGMWGDVLRADAAILEMNPRNLTTWLLLLARKLRRKPSVLWGHAWPRSGEGSRSDKLRHRMRSMADVVLVYTETQAQDLRRKMPHKRILAAPNALYHRAEMEHNLAQLNTVSRRTDFIFVGRLIEEKKPQLLLRAFIEAVAHLDEECRLIFVGEGPQRAELEAEAAKFGSQRVIFKGHQGEADVLRPLYGRAIASVSPGYVGLSITQSFSYGVPMLISRDEPHAPEIEAMIEGENSRFFESDSVAALAETLLQTYAARDRWAQRGPAIIRDCIERYSIETMVARIIEAAEMACKK